LAAAPIITRLYSPEDFGVFAVFGALLAIVTVVVCLRYELAIVLPADRPTAIAVLKLSCYAAIAVAALVTLVIAIFGTGIARLTEITDYRSVLAYIPVALILAGLYRAASYWTIREQGFGYLSASKLSQSVPQTATQLIFGYLAFGPMGLVIGDIVGKLGGNAMIWRGVSESIPANERKTDAISLKTAAGQYRRFPLISSWSAVINEVGSAVPTLLLASFFGPAIAGGYALVRRVIAIPMDLIGQSVVSVFVGEASRIHRDKQGNLRVTYLRYLRTLFLIGLGPAIALFVFGQSLFVFIFGSEWAAAGQYAQILSVGFLFRFAVSPLGQILTILERQDIQLQWDMARTILLIAAMTIPYILGFNVTYALAAYTFVLVVLQGAYVGIALTMIGREQP
jgi:O-antigen/teichoic acid export membrane protein